MKLTIHGAARQVTGSMHLLQVGQYKILIDCGLDYERDHSTQNNENFLFRPEEIELLVRGSDEPLDIASLRAVATYEGWPKEEGPPELQPQVVWFWDFFARIAPADQRKILSFVTASDRISAMGATNLVIRIQLIREKEELDMFGRPTNRPVERFPIARTCFNTLSLYRYASRQKLEEKLWTAVQGSEGFGLK